MDRSGGKGARVVSLLAGCGTMGLLAASLLAAVLPLTGGAGGEAEAGLTATAILSALAAFAGAALRWGADSRDGVDSAEWARRREWGS